MTDDMLTTLLEPRSQSGFVETDYVRNVMARGRSYLEAGFPVHLRGGSGTGKTTLAMHLAHLVGRPVVLLHGDEEFSTSHLVGGDHGYHLRKVVDNFIHSVRKTEEDFSRRWVDSRLTLACQHGFTLVYDEFTRSRPEANNVLLAILQEGMLDLPTARGSEGYLRVHPQFRGIFTSNPEEYVGTHKVQDALRDRMVTIDLGHFDWETEAAITQARSGVARHEAQTIVSLVRAFRDRARNGFAPTVRASIMIAKIVRARGATLDAGDHAFRETCLDVLSSEPAGGGAHCDDGDAKALIEDLIDEICASPVAAQGPREQAAAPRAQPVPSARERNL